MKFKLILNPKAGKGRRELGHIVDFFKRNKLNLDVYITKSAGDAILEAKRSVNYDCIIAAGGDGTINEVVNGIVGKNIALGVIPLGTANAFALDLGIPMELDKALHKIIRFKIRTIDVGRANDRYFILCCGAGFDAEVVNDVKMPELRRFKKLAFVKSALRLALMNKNQTVSAIIHGKKYFGKLIIASNSRYYAGKYLLGRRTKLDDGFLTVSIFDSVNFARVLKSLFAALAFGKVWLPGVHQMKAARIMIESKIPVLVHADAELIGNTPVTIKVVPKALKVIV